MFPASNCEESFKVIEAQESVADFLVISDEDRVKLSNIPGFQVHENSENCGTSQTCQNNQQTVPQSIQQAVVPQSPRTVLQPHQPCNHEQALTIQQPSILLKRSKSVPELNGVTKSPNDFLYKSKTMWTNSSTFAKSYSCAPSEYLNLHPCRLIVNGHTSIKRMHEDKANNSNSKRRCDFFSNKRKRKIEHGESNSGSINRESKIVDLVLTGGNGSAFTMPLLNSKPLNNKRDVNIPKAQADKQTSPMNCSSDLQLHFLNRGISNYKTDFAIPNHQNTVRSIGTDCVGLSDNQRNNSAISANNAKTLQVRNTSSVDYTTFKTLLSDANTAAVMVHKEISDPPSFNNTYLINKDHEMAKNISQNQQKETEPFSYVIGNETQQACLGMTGNEFVSSFTSETENEKLKSSEKDWISSSNELFAFEKNTEAGEEQAVMRVKRRLKFSEEKPAIDGFKVVMPLSPEIENLQNRIEHISPLMLNAANGFRSQNRITNSTESLFDFTSDDVKQMFDCVWDIYS